MSWLSSIGSSIGSAFKSVGKGIASVAKTGLSVIKTVATPLLSTAASMIPGVGPFLAPVVDALGNKLLGSDPGDASMDTGQVEQSPVMDAVAQATGQVVGLGSSPAAQAMSAAIRYTTPGAAALAAGNSGSATQEAIKKAGLLGTLSDITGIGDGKPGVFGIGDGKPGVFGIGTGKAQAKKAARDQAEAAAKGEGLTPKEIKLAGDNAEAQAEKNFDKPAAGSFSPIALAAAALLALLAL